MRTPTLLLSLAAILHATAPASAAQIGVDAVHGFDSSSILATGSAYSDFRATILAGGNTIVPLTSFDAANLAGLDGVILKIPYSSSTAFTPSNMTALHAFGQREAFLSDSSLWKDAGAGSDRPITFGDNQKLLQNIVSFISTDGILFVGDDGIGAQVTNFNTLVSPYGITYTTPATDSGGRTVTGFVAHPVTAGINTLGVDFQYPMSITSPAVDLTLGSGQDNIVAVVDAPEPASIYSLGFLSLALTLFSRTRRS